jgi:chromosome segregation ATPase
VADRLCGEALWQLRRARPALALRQCRFLPEAELKAVVSTSGFVLEFLTAKRQIVSQVVDGQTFYKISTADETVSFDETDEGILRLHLTLGRLHAEIAGIEGEIKELEAKAKESLRNGSRLVAKNHLKKRKTMKSSIEKKFAQLNNIEGILEGVVNAESNRSVVEAYRAGLDALKASLSSHNLEDVDELMDNIGETLNKGEGLSFMLARVPPDHSADLEELEKELEELEEVPPAPQGELEEPDLLAELERLAVHDSSLEPVILASGAARGEGRGSPVAL